MNTGFERINGKLVYLYHNGSIGELNNVKADLAKDKLEQYNFTYKDFNLQDSLKSELEILNMAEKSITVPLIATTYLSPLISIFQEEGILADYILYLVGKSRDKKKYYSRSNAFTFWN